MVFGGAGREAEGLGDESSLHGLLRTLVARGWIQTDARVLTHSVVLGRS